MKLYMHHTILVSIFCVDTRARGRLANLKIQNNDLDETWTTGS